VFLQRFAVLPRLALFMKRVRCARRDRLAIVIQLLVPISLVLIALSAGRAGVGSPDEQSLALDRLIPKHAHVVLCMY
jgi:hypothetical protein